MPALSSNLSIIFGTRYVFGFLLNRIVFPFLLFHAKQFIYFETMCRMENYIERKQHFRIVEYVPPSSTSSSAHRWLVGSQQTKQKKSVKTVSVQQKSLKLSGTKTGSAEIGPRLNHSHSEMLLPELDGKKVLTEDAEVGHQQIKEEVSQSDDTLSLKKEIVQASDHSDHQEAAAETHSERTIEDKDSKKWPDQHYSHQYRRLAQVELEYLKDQVNVQDYLVENYAQIIVQFGYIALFGTALPMASIYVLLLLYARLRNENWLWSECYQRPPPQTAKSIGSW